LRNDLEVIHPGLPGALFSRIHLTNTKIPFPVLCWRFPLSSDSRPLSPSCCGGNPTASTLFGLDVYRNVFNPEASGEETVRFGKLFGIILALLAMSRALLIIHAPEGRVAMFSGMGFYVLFR
jgi:hypothetical protein